MTSDIAALAPSPTEVESKPRVNLARVAKHVGLPVGKVEKTVGLLGEGNTVPFITRYRKDQTGGLDEQQIRAIAEELAKQQVLLDRKQTILRSIESQGKLTPELAKKIREASSTKLLEDLYLPYKPKKQTRATLARQRGLQLLADQIFNADPACNDLDTRAADFVNPDQEVTSAADALLGAGHILAEALSERADLRRAIRNIFRQTGKLQSVKIEADEKKSKSYSDYFDFSQPLAKLPPHRVLAINRGERAKVLRVKIESDSQAIEREAQTMLVPSEHPHQEFLQGCVRDALTRLILPSLEREVRREMTEKAETHAVEVFARNLRNLLLQAPVRGRRVLAVDPGFKSGCKMVALDEFGTMLGNDIFHLVGSETRKAEGRKKLVEMITQHNLSVVAIGNGTACRETEELLAELIAGELAERNISYVVVNEAGASVYSASPLGREELPDYDATVRGAVSIGRRLQDPLSELVKIDPASIGVGLYQHDIKGKHLRSSLDAVVESCVNYVGVELNTASPALLKYVSGLNQLTARRMFDYRNEHGPFTNRQQLLEVPGFGENAFVQAAGFLKIGGGDNPLDATWIHPESYPLAQKVLQRLECQVEDLRKSDSELSRQAAQLNTQEIAQEWSAGELLLKDIVVNLTRPGRDPREDLPAPIFRKGIVKLDDLEVGMELIGTVLNVVDFGAFVDIGLSDSGLVHISQLANRYIRDPHEAVSVGDNVRTWVMEIDKNRRRVSLTMIEPGTQEKPQPHPPRRAKPTEKPRADPRRKKRVDRAKKPTDARPKPKPKPMVPITEAMAKGKEPLRTFGDLAQFYEKKQDPDSPKKSGK